jgi:hypothetical protein
LGGKKTLKFFTTTDFIALSEMKDVVRTTEWLGVIKSKADLSPCIHLQRKGKTAEIPSEDLL